MKSSILFLSAAIVLSSCGSYTATGAYAGSMLGSILGSAIGGINDGPRGSDFGSIIGMAGGAAVGAVIGSAADKAAQDQYEQDRQSDYQQRNSDRCEQQNSNETTSGQYPSQSQVTNKGNSNQDLSGYDPSNSGDDRIYEYNDEAYNGNYSAAKPQTVSPSDIIPDGAATTNYGFKLNPTIEIRNARFVDNNKDGTLNAGEESKIIFEVMNNSSETLYDVQPTVVETTGNKHIFISPNIHVESIAPGKGIRYTATVMADKRLKDGVAKFSIAVAQGNNKITSHVKEFQIVTKR